MALGGALSALATRLSTVDGLPVRDGQTFSHPPASLPLHIHLVGAASEPSQSTSFAKRPLGTRINLVTNQLSMPFARAGPHVHNVASFIPHV